ncbi:MAG: hypothetical protein ACI8PZ_001953 [Myxococcota bacterium]|jgi:hypothetical protein
MMLWWIVSAAFAQTCDVGALQAQLAEASPVAVPRAYLALAGCDPAAAKASADVALPRTLAGRDGNDAALAALDVGAHDAVAKWIRALESGERTTAIDFLGATCGEHAEVANFFAASFEREGKGFWDDRWYRGLADCRTEANRATLNDALNDPYLQERGNRGLYFGLLEVYARNLGAAALPSLEAALAANADSQDASLVVRAFADAANVGQLGGMDAKAAKKSVETLVRLAPSLSPTVIDTVRDTLRALGDDATSEAMARHRWKSRFSGGYTYVAVAHELVTCKNGKQQATFHYGDLNESGARFPDTVLATLDATLEGAWGLDAAEKCKGEGEIIVAMTPEPVEGEAAVSEWLEAQRETFKAKSSGFSKVEEKPHGPTPI